MRKLGMNFGADGGKERPVEERLAGLVEHGFTAIFTGLHGTADAVRDLSLAARAAGVDYDFIHAPFKGINNIWKEGEDGEAQLNTLITCAEACAHGEVPMMVIHLSSGDNAPCVNDLGIARFDRLIERCGELGVQVAMENQRKIGNLACLLERYAKEKHVGFCWDNGHEACFTPGMEYMPWFGKRLMCLHIHDNRNVYNDDCHYLPFDGEIDFTRVAELIRESGFGGTLMLETKGVGSNLYSSLTPNEFLERAYRRANRLREMIDGKEA